MEDQEIEALASYLKALNYKANRKQAFQWYTGNLPADQKRIIEKQIQERWKHAPKASRETYRRVSELATKYRYGC